MVLPYGLEHYACLSLVISEFCKYTLSIFASSLCSVVSIFTLATIRKLTVK
jgi:hypothetical protein